MVRKLVDPLNIGRVIARPFIGSVKTGFDRTGNRRDFLGSSAGTDACSIRSARTATGCSPSARSAISSPIKGVTDLAQGQRQRGILRSDPESCAGSPGRRSGVHQFCRLRHVVRASGAMYRAMPRRWKRSMRMLPRFAKLLKRGDLVIMTADHGCDPTWRGTDHTRERVPVLGFGPGIAPRDIGVRSTYADIGATLAQHLGLPATGNGRSFL
jgi:phosphopentomutase